MSGNQSVLGLVGSPNKAGRTNELVSAALEGASRAGAATGHRFFHHLALHYQVWY